MKFLIGIDYKEGVFMSVVRKADFYYGALMSVLINNGIVPVIIERGESRRIYTMTTNKGNYEIYAKYVSSPIKRKNKDVKLWHFNFSYDEVQSIKNYEEKDKNYYFALICGYQDNFQESEIAILTLEQVKNCLDIDYKRESYRISIKVEKGGHGLKVYGTGRSDILNGKDNTIRVQRDLVSSL